LDDRHPDEAGDECHDEQRAEAASQERHRYSSESSQRGGLCKSSRGARTIAASHSNLINHSIDPPQRIQRPVRVFSRSGIARKNVDLTQKFALPVPQESDEPRHVTCIHAFVRISVDRYDDTRGPDVSEMWGPLCGPCHNMLKSAQRTLQF
jgi:hypothetical protein